MSDVTRHVSDIVTTNIKDQYITINGRNERVGDIIAGLSNLPVAQQVTRIQEVHNTTVDEEGRIQAIRYRILRYLNENPATGDQYQTNDPDGYQLMKRDSERWLKKVRRMDHLYKAINRVFNKAAFEKILARVLETYQLYTLSENYLRQMGSTVGKVGQGVLSNVNFAELQKRLNNEACRRMTGKGRKGDLKNSAKD